MQTLRELGEIEVIARLTRFLPDSSTIIVGAGDDCAVVRDSNASETDWVLTSDPVVQGIHFGPDADPAAIGHKACGRVLSDLAAMGAKPAWALVDITAPSDLRVSVLETVYRGITALASEHGLLIVGGDVAEGPALEIHIFAIGRSPRGKAVLRTGARPGDLLFVTGRLGGSRTGRHLTFEPRVREGLWLRNRATAMIDLSDGLAGDLRHIVDMSHVGCDLNTAAIPLAEAARTAPDGRPPLDHALHDGEDFELLFTLPESDLPVFTQDWQSSFPDLPCSMIGSITDQQGLIRCIFPDGESVALEQGGFAHFH